MRKRPGTLLPLDGRVFRLKYVERGGGALIKEHPNAGCASCPRLGPHSEIVLTMIAASAAAVAPGTSAP